MNTVGFLRHVSRDGHWHPYGTSVPMSGKTGPIIEWRADLHKFMFFHYHKGSNPRVICCLTCPHYLFITLEWRSVYDKPRLGRSHYYTELLFRPVSRVAYSAFVYVLCLKHAIKYIILIYVAGASEHDWYYCTCSPSVSVFHRKPNGD